MKQIIEQTEIFTTDNETLEVSLQCETLTDSSQVYNVLLCLHETRQPYTTFLENSDSTSKRQATAKYNRLVKALQGFELIA